MDTWTTLQQYDACSQIIGPNPCTRTAYWEIASTGEDVETREETEIYAQACRTHLEHTLMLHELQLTGTYHHVERHYC